MLFRSIFSVGSFWYQRKQANIAERDFASRVEANAKDAEWTQRYEKLSRQLLRISPGLRVTEQGNDKEIFLFTEIFPDHVFRKELTETVIGLNGSNTKFERREMQPHELNSPYLRQRIADAEKLINEFRKKHPKLPNYLGD